MKTEESTGDRLGKFYACGKEIKWDNMIEFNVCEKGKLDEENNEDVVVETAVVENHQELVEADQPKPEAFVRLFNIFYYFNII